jgi:hypothetical protein
LSTLSVTGPLHMLDFHAHISPSYSIFIGLEIKSAVIHFQGKVFNSGCFLAINLWILGEGQLRREL